jgi:hypothetical protein
MLDRKRKKIKADRSREVRKYVGNKRYRINIAERKKERRKDGRETMGKMERSGEEKGKKKRR